MNIEEKEITRVCSICKKKYKDTQTVINGFSCYNYAICDDCRKKYIDGITFENKDDKNLHQGSEKLLEYYIQNQGD